MTSKNRQHLGWFLAATLTLGANTAAAQQDDDDLLLTNPIVGDEMVPLSRVPNYRNQMREIIQELSDYARKRDPSFAIVARPGFELLRWDQREFILAEAKRPQNMMIPEDAIVPLGLPMRRFIQAIDGIALSDQFCGEGIPLPRLQRFQAMGVAMLSIEHCGSDAAAFGALEQSQQNLIVSHADADRSDVFNRVPVRRPIDENADNIETLDDVRNMLVATESRPNGSRGDWLLSIASTNYDVVVIDAFYNGNEPLTVDDIHSLKFKELGAKRLVLAWLDITHAGDDRFYWEPEWDVGSPSWIVGRHPDRMGTFAVEYWHPRWKSIVGTYFKGLMDLGFDGVLLNGTESYLRFEAMTPLDPL
ncbi:MAG: hypothetical protein GKS03_15530 [Alphaproteobacteria bacterium]|nr:hypothetical protein [Alphaproteobacteria bacterium]